jgi:hypothetical protein
MLLAYSFERWNGLGKVPLPELRNAEIERNSGLVGFKLERFAVLGCGLRSIVQGRESNAQIRMGSRALRVCLDDLTPKKFSVMELACLHQLDGLPRSIRLGECAEGIGRQEQNCHRDDSISENCAGKTISGTDPARVNHAASVISSGVTDNLLLPECQASEG